MFTWCSNPIGGEVINPSYLTFFTDVILKYTLTSANNPEVSAEKDTEVGPSGALDLPQIVTNDDITYTVNSIAKRGFQNYWFISFL